MKVIKEKKYIYSKAENKKWEKEDFKPVKDFKVGAELIDGCFIEFAAFTVNMENKNENHACVSVQAGCKFGCKFCSSGKNGFFRNLSSSEILEELSELRARIGNKPFDRIVFMGIGEPFDNIDEVVICIKTLLSDKALYSGKRRIAMATVGLPHKLKEFSLLNLPVDIWISLHAADDKKRAIIMPVASAISIKEIIKSAVSYSKINKTMVCINYMLFVGFNNIDSDAVNLAKILNKTENNFALLITEPNCNFGNYKAASYGDLLDFEKKLRFLGVKNEIYHFMTAGKKIGAGCGEFIFIKK